MCLPEWLQNSRVVQVLVFETGDKYKIMNYRIVAISTIFLKIYKIDAQSKLMCIVNPNLSNPKHGFDIVHRCSQNSRAYYVGQNLENISQIGSGCSSFAQSDDEAL